MTANLLFFAFYVVLSRLSRTILCVEQEERLESRRQLPEEWIHIPFTEGHKKEHVMCPGRRKGDTTHMQLLLDQSAKDGHRVKIFKSEKDVLREFPECIRYSRFNAGTSRGN